MTDTENEQEKFWAGEFGTQYISRNKSEKLLAANLNMFSKILSKLDSITSVTEYGCNIGMNFKVLKQLLPGCSFRGIEINESAVKLAREEHPDIQFIHRSILEVDTVKSDLTFTKGVLIHIEPNNLSKIYDNLYKNSNRYILIAEYYNSQQVSLSYRGNKNKLFKRDFAGDLLDKYSGLKLIDYGFCYHRDTLFSQDDISWFLLEK